MQREHHRLAGFLLAGMAVAGPLADLAPAQTRTEQPQPGFNLFTVEQDIELGRQSAIEAEKQLRLLNDRNTDNYLNRIVQRLAAVAPGARYPYQIRPSTPPKSTRFRCRSPVYVNRGLLSRRGLKRSCRRAVARDGHVAMRHGTHQASKAYLTRSGLGILGGLFGRGSGSAATVLNAIGGWIDAMFLKFSRDDEYEADQVGVQIMANAGYDPGRWPTFRSDAGGAGTRSQQARTVLQRPSFVGEP
jgi:predicted Zn-dependent protease